MSRWILSILVLGVVGSLLPAADLASVPRVIAKQPKYLGQPQYCLLILGRDLTHRVWLVRDGDTLYADRNGNGDLTEADEKIVGKKDETDVDFSVGTLRIAGREHRHLVVSSIRLSKVAGEAPDPVSRAALEKNPAADLMAVRAEVQVPGLKGGGDDGRVPVYARSDANGPLLFGDTPEKAPIVHLAGPLQIQPEEKPSTLVRNVVCDLMLVVGTPGVGPGTFASVAYEDLIPSESYAVVEAEWPAAKPAEPPVRARYELKERC